ncbi:MAG: hypothetical protein ACI4GY_08275 [Acutalibacteraceae bacterium]
MKKALSVFMAVLMLFAALSVGTSASSSDPSPWHGELGSGKPATMEQAVLKFELNGGKLKTGAYVYDTTTGEFSYQDGITGTYVMVPRDEEHATMKAGTTVVLPVVTAPAGWEFTGWYCYTDQQSYAANCAYKLPADCGGQVIEFGAAYTPAEVEEDTFTKVLGILIKVFGAIIGLIMYAGDTEAGVALMEKILGGVLG